MVSHCEVSTQAAGLLAIFSGQPSQTAPCCQTGHYLDMRGQAGPKCFFFCLEIVVFRLSCCPLTNLLLFVHTPHVARVRALTGTFQINPNPSLPVELNSVKLTASIDIKEISSGRGAVGSRLVS